MRSLWSFLVLLIQERHFRNHLMPKRLVFFEKLNSCNRRTAILLVKAPFNERFLAPHDLAALPSTLASLKDAKYLEYNHLKLIELILEDSLVFSEEQAINLERFTPSQHKSSLWFQHRAGRITGSKSFATQILVTLLSLYWNPYAFPLLADLTAKPLCGDINTQSKLWMLTMLFKRTSIMIFLSILVV